MAASSPGGSSGAPASGCGCHGGRMRRGGGGDGDAALERRRGPWAGQRVSSRGDEGWL